MDNVQLKENPEIGKAAEDMAAHLSTFSHEDQVIVFNRFKEKILDIRQNTFERMQTEKAELEKRIEILAEGSKVINN